MKIEFVDSKVKTVAIKTLNPGDVFMIPDDFNDVCMNIGLYNDNGRYQYIILGELHEIMWAQDGDFQVRPVKSKLIVEI